MPVTTRSQSNTITFMNKVDNLDDYQSPYGQLDELSLLVDPGTKVITSEEVNVAFSYPFNDQYIFTFHNPGGWTRLEIYKAIFDQYNKMYDEEQETSNLPIEPMYERFNRCVLINRARTDGKYGIWGHDIGDLGLYKLYKHKNILVHVC